MRSGEPAVLKIPAARIAESFYVHSPDMRSSKVGPEKPEETASARKGKEAPSWIRQETGQNSEIFFLPASSRQRAGTVYRMKEEGDP